MILIDIGNSTTQYATLVNGDIQDKHRISTDQIEATLKNNSSHACIVSSVVPQKNAWINATFNRVHFVSSETITGLSIQGPNPHEVGADRLVNALAAYNHTKNHTLIIDSGTALTFCYVDNKGCYHGGNIFPGMGICSKALHDYTAKIPLITVKKTTELIGHTTNQAVSSGLFHGFLVLIQGMIKLYKQRCPQITVIGTGYGLDLFKDQFLEMDLYDKDLIFKGLKLLSSTLPPSSSSPSLL